MPLKPDAFLNDFLALCRKNGIAIGSKLGAGGFGYVYAGTVKSPYPNDPDMSNEVAVKIIVYNEKTRDKVDYEVRTQMKFSHPNLVRVFKEFDGLGYKVVVMEKLEKTLHEHINESPGSKLSESETRTLIRQVVRGLVYIHERGYTHRDLKPGNILMKRDKLTNEWILKICDFGFIKETSDDMKTFLGTPGFMGPEYGLSENLPRGPEVDIWALGVTVYMMLEGHLYVSLPEHVKGKDLVYATSEAVSKSTNVELSPAFSPAARDFVARLLTVNPKQRLTFEQLQTHPFLLDTLTVRVPLSVTPPPTTASSVTSTSNSNELPVLYTCTIDAESITYMLETRSLDKEKVVRWERVAEHVLKKLREDLVGVARAIPPEATARDARIIAYSDVGGRQVVQPGDVIEAGSWEALLYVPTPAAPAPLPVTSVGPEALMPPPPPPDMRRGNQLCAKAAAAVNPTARALNLCYALEAYLAELRKCDSALVETAARCAGAHSAIMGVEAVCISLVKGPLTKALTAAYSNVGRQAALRQTTTSSVGQRQRAPGLNILIPQRTIEPLSDYETRKRGVLAPFYATESSAAEVVSRGVSEEESGGSEGGGSEDGEGEEKRRRAREAMIENMQGLCTKACEVVKLYEYAYGMDVDTFVLYWNTLAKAVKSLNFLTDSIIPAAVAIAEFGKKKSGKSSNNSNSGNESKDEEEEECDVSELWRRVDEYNALTLSALEAHPNWLVQQYVPAPRAQQTKEDMVMQVKRLEFECLALSDKNELLRKRLEALEKDNSKI